MHLIEKINRICGNNSFEVISQKWKNQEIKIEDCLDSNIDNEKFWKYICNIHPEAYCSAAKTFHEVNNLNLQYASSLGFFISFENIRRYQNNYPNFKLNSTVVEIGPGLGATRDFLKTIFKEYIGIDIYPRFEDVIKYQKQLPNIENVSMVVSSNVFQHLSIEIRNVYYNWINKILNNDGCFFITNVFKNSIVTNKYYEFIFHFGQIIPIQSMNEIMTDLHQAGLKILSITQRDDYNIGIFGKKI